MEALSRGAALAVCVDSAREAIRCVNANIESLGFSDRARVRVGDVFHVIKDLDKQGSRFNIIFADPPYTATVNTADGAVSIARHIVEAIDASHLLEEGGRLFLENPKGLVIPDDRLKNLHQNGCRQYGKSALYEYTQKR